MFPSVVSVSILSSLILISSPQLEVVAQANTSADASGNLSNLQNVPGFSSFANNSTNTTANANPTNNPNQTSNGPMTNPGTNLRIPADISPGCQNYLAQLNSNPNITSCTAPLLNATNSFASGPKSVTRDQVKKAFDGLCGTNSGSACAPHMMYNILNQFTSSCSQELYSGVEAVRMAYDVLYMLTPYRVALCSKDSATGDYCPSVVAAAVVNGTSSPSSSKSSNMTTQDFGAMVSSVFGDKLVTQLGPSSPISTTNNHPVLQTRDEPSYNSTASNSSAPAALSSSNQTQHMFYNPAPDTYTNTNLAFLFLSPLLPDSALCKPCTQSVLAAYIGFEQAIPHFGGLGSSSYLSGQLKLWKAISSRCGEKFLDEINQEAGIMSTMTTSDAAHLVLNILFRNLLNLKFLSVSAVFLVSARLLNIY